MKANAASRPGMQKGWVRLWRKFMDNPLWKERRKFSRAEAFLDMVMSANGTDKTVLFDGKPILIKRGQLLTSERKLAERWGWSKTKTRLLLFYCQNSDRSIIVNSDHKKSLITIINYNTYNPLTKAEKTTNADEEKTTERPQKNHRLAPTNKRVNKEERMEKEKDPFSLTPFPKSFDKEDLRLTQLLLDLILKNNPKSKAGDLTLTSQEEWLNQCQLLRETDNRTPEEIETVIRFSQKDRFWKTVILSMPTLRQKFDQLWMKAKTEDKLSGIKEWLEEQERKDKDDDASPF